MSLLQLKNVTKRFGGVVAVDDLSFEVKKKDRFMESSDLTVQAKQRRLTASQVFTALKRVRSSGRARTSQDFTHAPLQTRYSAYISEYPPFR